VEAEGAEEEAVVVEEDREAEEEEEEVALVAVAQEVQGAAVVLTRMQVTIRRETTILAKILPLGAYLAGEL
jgi:hypothetical protein